MKNLSYYIIVCFGFGFLSCQEQVPVTKNPPSTIVKLSEKAIPNQSMEMTVEGMTCAIGCAATIEKKLNTITGISSATVDFESKKALVLFDNTKISPQEISAVVSNVGPAYSISSFSILD